VIVRDFAELEEYLPPGHHGVLNRLLAGRSLGDTDQVSVWHGRLEPGGGSERHVHEASVQIYIGITGVMTLGVGESEAVLRPLGAAVIPAGEPHFIENRSTGLAEMLVVSVPALR
jgi:quercetin dioxygenase-like cupin family protein